MTQIRAKFAAFAALHVPGDPLILFNVWDAGSAKAVAEAGAKAIATGSASVAAAHGFDDAEGLPLGLALANAARIVAAVDLPVTIDFEGGYAVEPEGVAANMKRLAATGAIGCNFEDQMVGGEGLHAIAVQAARIARGARRGRARISSSTRAPTSSSRRSAKTHDEAMVDAALERARAYAEAGASGFFVPRPRRSRACSSGSAPPRRCRSISWPGPARPPAAEVAAAGVARISHGPFPHKAGDEGAEGGGGGRVRRIDLAARAALASRSWPSSRPRFADPETERAFLRAERDGARPGDPRADRHRGR